MIEMNKIDFTSSKDELNIDIKDDSAEEELDIDTSSFIVLMNQQILIISDDDKESVIQSKESIKEIDISDIKTDNSQKVKSSQPPSIQTKITADSQVEPLIIDDNVALAWINSENYQPPIQQLKSDQEVPVNHQMIYTSNEDDTLDLTEYTPTDTQINEALSPSTPIKKEPIKAIFDKTPELQPQNDLLKNLQIPHNLKESSEIMLNPQYTVQDKDLTHATIDTFDIVDTVNIPKQSQAAALQVNEFNPTKLEGPKNLNIPVEVSEPQWADQFSEHIVWLGQQGLKTAIIKIHPEDLGPLEISIKVVENSASVNVTSHNNHVRDIVEQSMPRLREMMAEHGLQLSETHVGTDANSRQSQGQNSAMDQDTDYYVEDDVLLTPLKHKKPKGLIDYFA